MDNPVRLYHLREIGRLVKLNHKSVAIYVKKLLGLGLIIHHTDTLFGSYSANEGNLMFRRYKSLSNQVRLYESGLVDYLIDHFSQPEAIVLFGSFSKGEDGPQSDIDILVISPVKKYPDLAPFEKSLGRRIQLFQHTVQDLHKIRSTNKQLLNNWLNGIVLHGFLEVIR